MRASSLFFIVILAVWAAYMVQHWVRRREDLATARSVDRFSEAMRMLERGTPVRRDASAPTQRGPVLHRASTPEVTVKGQGSSAVSNQTGKEPTMNKFGKKQFKAPQIKGVSAKVGSREFKAGLLLGSAVFFVLTFVLAVVSIVSWWLPLVGLMAIVGTVYWLRSSAVAAQAKKQVRPVRAAAPAKKSVERQDQSASKGSTKVEADGERQIARPVTRTAQPAAEVAEKPVEKVERRSPLVAERAVAQAPVEEEVFDQEPDTNALLRAEAEVFGEGWAPVYAPTPTYQLKAKAERPAVAPAATTPAPSEDSRPLAAQYENTPVDELPFDGMALDEDYDELPAVYRAS